jgi:hypothetical protein
MVIYCKTHDVYYTVYPPGHVPYGRAPVAAHGAGDGLERWRGTVFESMVSQGWRRKYEYVGGRCWQTHRRWLRCGGKLLGLSGEVTVGEGVAALLEIPLHVHAAARDRFSSGRVADECAALTNVLSAVAVTPRLWRQMMRAGRLTGMLGDAWEWTDDGCLEALFPVVESGARLAACQAAETDP